MSTKTRRDFLHLGVALSAGFVGIPLLGGQETAGLTTNPHPPAPIAPENPPGNLAPAQRPANQIPPLSWERDHPARIAWSTFLIAEVTKALPQLEPAKDIEEFYPTYSKADDKRKIAMWAEIIVLIAFYESAWEPCARYHEMGLGNYSITHQPVFSEGLLQLSYQDMDVYPNLSFDWEKDKSLAPTDCAKTILDPFKNLSAGVQILATQIQTYGRIVLRNHFYWSTLQDPATGKHSRVERMKLLAARWAGTASSS